MCNKKLSRVTSSRDLAAVRTTSLPGSLFYEVAVPFIGARVGECRASECF